MDPATLYYYALSTLAQCAAALAALIGFLSLWWWERLRERVERANRLLSAVRSTEQLKDSEAREAALKGEQHQLVHAIYRFLILTLAILVVAIVLIMFVDVLSSRVWTAWVVKGVIGLMSLGLGVGPFYMVRKVVRSLAAIGILALLLLASSTLAGPAVRCTSTYSPTLQQWTTTGTPPPGQTCTRRLNPTTGRWEESCR